MKLSLKLPARFAPRKPRSSVLIEATLLLPDDDAVPIAIKNISAQGFMGETRAEVEPEALIGVALSDYGIVPARVRWSSDGELGAEFRRPLDLERLEQYAQARTGERKLFRSRIVQGPL